MSTDDGSLLDRKTLILFFTDTCAEDQQFMREMGDIFVESIPGLIDAMERGLDEQNATEVRRAAHSFKSSSRIFGAFSLADRCERVEHLANEGALDQIPPLYAKIAEEADLLSKTIHDEIDLMLKEHLAT